jgi:hypothetical protein
MPKRDYVFVDESGDPGLPGSGSPYFACLAMHTTDDSLAPIIDCFSDMRFYRHFNKEMKSLDKDPFLRPRLASALAEMVRTYGVRFSVTCLEKAKYTGPYLVPGEGTRFRNFQLRRLLEWHFKDGAPATSECELVLDRHSHSPSQLQNLVEYVNGNYNLPNFAAVTAVDSRYVEAIQVADLCLRMYKGKYVERQTSYQGLDLAFVRVRDVTAMVKGWAP